MARPRHALLTKERIVEAAAALIDAEGLEACSMRRLATELGVQGPSLYHHFATKAEIVDAVAEAVVARVDLTVFQDNDWRDGLRLWATSYHAVLAAHPNIVPVLATGPGRRPAGLAMAEAVYGALIEAGWSRARATHIGALMRYLITGSAIGSFALGFDADPELYDRYPHLHRAHELAAHRAAVDEGAFELGLDLLINGLSDRYDQGGTPMTSVFRDKHWIGGAFVPPESTDRIEVENPYTEQVIGHVPAGTAEDVNLAVSAARNAFDGWAYATSAAERGAALDRLHRALAARADEIARIVGLELGTPLKIAKAVQAGLPLTVLAGYAELAAHPPVDEVIGNSLVVHEPVGVVGAITPWNYPLHQVVAKVGAALAAGNTVVLKPSELTPLTAYLLADAFAEAALPPGVFNLVTGTGPVVGSAIAGHPDVDMVSFTGSTTTGRAISHAAADRIARVSLELGGKSANVILSDADLVKAVKVGVGNAFLNSGQTCTAWTRMLVHRGHYDEAVELAAKTAAGYTLGDPFDPATRLGPLASAGQKQRVRGFIERATARLVAGGLDAPVPSTGHFVAATVFADVDPDSELAQEEIFGPVLSIIPFDSDDEAVAIANNSKYGLAGAVWGSGERALAVARRLRTGAVDVNGGSFNPFAPFGGYKQSGIGRELGAYGLAEFQQVKAIQQ